MKQEPSTGSGDDAELDPVIAEHHRELLRLLGGDEIRFHDPDEDIRWPATNEVVLGVRFHQDIYWNGKESRVLNDNMIPWPRTTTGPGAEKIIPYKSGIRIVEKGIYDFRFHLQMFTFDQPAWMLLTAMLTPGNFHQRQINAHVPANTSYPLDVEFQSLVEANQSLVLVIQNVLAGTRLRMGNDQVYSGGMVRRIS
ncbi:MAG: hypothetical protein KDK70_06775 [Myxococcales bacterium]|nr:hypothetical protein [Myxococcales bacterium]